MFFPPCSVIIGAGAAITHSHYVSEYSNEYRFLIFHSIPVNVVSVFGIQKHSGQNQAKHFNKSVFA